MQQEHCTGTLVIHVGGVVECTDDSCTDLTQVWHTLVVDCTTVDGGCVCTLTELVAQVS